MPEGQQRLGGMPDPVFTTKISGSQPDGARLKLKGGAQRWERGDIDRQEEVVLIVTAKCTGVAIVDELNADGYVVRTWRDHTLDVVDLRPATELEQDVQRSRTLRETGSPSAMPATNVRDAARDFERSMDDMGLHGAIQTTRTVAQLQVGSTFLYEDTEVTVQELLGGGDGIPVRLLVNTGEVLELDEDDSVTVIARFGSDDDGEGG